MEEAVSERRQPLYFSKYIYYGITDNWKKNYLQRK